MPSDMILNRRAFAVGLATAAALSALPRPALALSADAAKALVDKTVATVNSIINSGKSEAAMLKDFEKLFVTYADVPTIARSVLGTLFCGIGPLPADELTERERAWLAAPRHP